MFHSLPWFKPHSYYCIYWAWRSWTVSWSAQGMRRIIVLTVFCPKQLHVSQYTTLWWHIVKPLKPDQGLDKLPTTQSVWLEHTRRSQVQAWALCSDTCHLRHNCTVRCRQDCFGCKSTCMNTCWWIQRYWTHTCIKWVEEPASWACTYW